MKKLLVGIALLAASVGAFAQGRSPFTNPPSGGGVEVGAAVTSGTANRVLYACGSPVLLCDSANLTFDGTSLSMPKALVGGLYFRVDSGSHNTFVLSSTAATDVALVSFKNGSGKGALTVPSDGFIGFASGVNNAYDTQDSLFVRGAAGHIKAVGGAGGATDGMFSLGATTLTLTAGALGMPKMTASGTAPGATGAKLELVCGTNAGSAKLIVAAGTSGTAVTVVDNIGAGVTGC